MNPHVPHPGATRTLTRNGTFYGVVSMDIKMSSIDDYLTKTYNMSSRRELVFIVDSSGFLIASNVPGTTAVAYDGKNGSADVLPAADAGETISRAYAVAAANGFEPGIVNLDGESYWLLHESLEDEKGPSSASARLRRALFGSAFPGRPARSVRRAGAA